MSATSTVVAVMFAGLLISMLAMCIAVLARRPELTPGALFWAGSNLVAHPERYVKPEALGAFKAVSFLGAAVFVTGAFISVFQALAMSL